MLSEVDASLDALIFKLAVFTNLSETTGSSTFAGATFSSANGATSVFSLYVATCSLATSSMF